MTLNYVALTLDLYDAQGNPVITGEALFTPSAQLTDTSNHQLIVQAPVPCVFHAAGLPVVSLLATDNGAPAPSGWAWSVSFTGVPGSPAAFSFFLPYASGASQKLSDQAPAASVVTMAAYLPLSGGVLTGPVGVPVTTATTTHSTSIADCVTLCNAAGGAFTDTLPDATAVRAGAPYIFKKTDATANEVTLMPAGSQTIDGGTYMVLAVPNTAVTLRSDGSNWQAF